MHFLKKITCMYSLRNDMYIQLYDLFKKNQFYMVKKTLKNVNICTVSASSGLQFLCHWMNGSEITMGFPVKAH